MQLTGEDMAKGEAAGFRGLSEDFMNRTAVVSSNVASVGYEASTMILEVEFLSGSVYQYFDVPEAVYLELVMADSVGGYLSQNIKGSYRYSRI